MSGKNNFDRSKAPHMIEFENALEKWYIWGLFFLQGKMGKSKAKGFDKARKTQIVYQFRKSRVAFANIQSLE